MATMVLMRHGWLHCAWVGLACAFLCRDGAVVALNKPHFVTSDDIAQPLKAGAKLVDDRLNGQTRSSRCFGLSTLASQGLVHCTLEHNKEQISPADEFVVIVSSTVMTVLSPETIVGTVRDIVQQGLGAQAAVTRLIATAQDKHCAGDAVATLYILSPGNQPPTSQPTT